MQVKALVKSHLLEEEKVSNSAISVGETILMVIKSSMIAKLIKKENSFGTVSLNFIS